MGVLNHIYSEPSKKCYLTKTLIADWIPYHHRARPMLILYNACRVFVCICLHIWMVRVSCLRVCTSCTRFIIIGWQIAGSPARSASTCVCPWNVVGHHHNMQHMNSVAHMQQCNVPAQCACPWSERDMPERYDFVWTEEMVMHIICLFASQSPFGYRLDRTTMMMWWSIKYT